MKSTKIIWYYCATLVLFSVTFTAQSQSFNTYLNTFFTNQIDDDAAKPENPFHTNVKPYKTDKLDSSWFNNITPYPIGRKKFLGRVADNLLNDYLIRIDTGDLFIRVTPIIDFQYGIQTNPEKKIYTNTRGFLINGYITKRLTFSTSFYENQSVFPDYVTRYIQRYKVVPGQGFVRPFKNGAGFDYGMAEGYISYSALKYFNVELGHGKHFIGDGYRSLLLSDYAFNYPYLKFTTEIWKLRYTNLFAQFQQLEGNPAGRGYPKKFGSFHILSLNIGQRLHVGLFESIIWRGSDSSGYRGFDINYLNPIIFYRPVEFSLGSADNALIGFNAKYKLASKVNLYGQLILDDFNIAELKKRSGFIQQKYGFQAGIKTFDLLLKKSIFRLEYNQVQPYVYGHRVPRQNYVHYNQPLAHPLMANFREIVADYEVNINRWNFGIRNIHALTGKDSSHTHYGNNIFQVENDVQGFPVQYKNQVLQGVKTRLNFLNIRLAYLINPKINLRIEANYISRTNKSNLVNEQTNLFSLSLKTGIRNYYYDF